MLRQINDKPVSSKLTGERSRDKYLALRGNGGLSLTVGVVIRGVYANVVASEVLRALGLVEIADLER
jgi:hypothetical protein